MGDYVNTCPTSCSILLIFPERHFISLRIWWSRVYCLPSHPPWNHTKTVLMFAIIYFFTPAQHRHPLYLKQRAIRIPGKCIYEWLHMFIFCLPCPPPHQHHHRNYYYYHHQHQQATMLDIPARTNSSDQHHIVMESCVLWFSQGTQQNNITNENMHLHIWVCPSPSPGTESTESFCTKLLLSDLGLLPGDMLKLSLDERDMVVIWGSVLLLLHVNRINQVILEQEWG